MCQSASFIATRSKVYFSRKGDSHSEILREQKIPDLTPEDCESFAKVELVPPRLDYGLPFERWRFSFDGDIPRWARDVAEVIERDCRALLPSWAKSHFLPEDGTWEVSEDMTRFVLRGKPVVTQSGGVLNTLDQSKPEVTQSGGVLNTLGESSPVVTQSGGELNTYGQSKPKVTQSGGMVCTYDQSKPEVTQSGGELNTLGQSSPKVTQSGGLLSTYGQSSPQVTQSGGLLSTHGQSSPQVMQSGGALCTYDQSKPKVTKIEKK